jgi:hypothetical protein
VEARRTLGERQKPVPGLMRSVLQFFGGFLLLALIMLGVGGTLYKLLAPEGWIAQLFGGSLGYLGAIVLALVGVVTFAWFAQDQIAPTRRDGIGDWWVYLCGLAGLFYAAEILWRGSM